MTRFLAFFQRLFGARLSSQEDDLGGPLDLSDTAYCLNLLKQEQD